MPERLDVKCFECGGVGAIPNAPEVRRIDPSTLWVEGDVIDISMRGPGGIIDGDPSPDSVYYVLEGIDGRLRAVPDEYMTAFGIDTDDDEVTLYLAQFETDSLGDICVFRPGVREETCAVCKGRQRVPTRYGEELIEFLKKHWRDR